jgi:myosin-light-chain kinase
MEKEIVAKRLSFGSDYEVIDLDHQAHRSVISARSKINTEMVSFKSISKEECYLELAHIKTGLEIWRKLDHSGIAKLRDVYEDKKQIIIVFESVQGGDLYCKLGNKLIFTEKRASKLIHQVIQILSYLHSQNVIHSNIKAEDFIFEDKKQKKIKLCSFDKAHSVLERRTENHGRDNPKALPPEILEGKAYSFASDVYCVGVMLYKMLSNCLPLENKNSEVTFPQKEWSGITSTVKELLTQMLSKDPSKRPTVKALSDHPWVRGTIALLDVKDARSDSESAKDKLPSHKTNSRPFIERHNNSEPDHKTVDFIPKPIDPKLDKYNKEYFETIMKQDRGISGWTFSDILGLAVSEISSDGAISPTNSEDLNTKSSASTVTSPRSPQPMGNSINSGSDAASASAPHAATDDLQDGKTDPDENKKTLKKEHKSPRTPKTRKSELHLKKTKTKSPRKEKDDKDENDENKKSDEMSKKKMDKERRRAIELEETIKLLETKIISITSINAALEDQLDQTLAENRKLLQERMLAQSH